MFNEYLAGSIKLMVKNHMFKTLLPLLAELQRYTTVSTPYETVTPKESPDYRCLASVGCYGLVAWTL